MRVMVLGGTGFLGRHVVAALLARGHVVVVGSRNTARKTGAAASACDRRRVRFEQLVRPAQWNAVTAGVEAVVNCVGILRERHGETYECLHHRAPVLLARACAGAGIRLVHVSALGLHPCARSRFIRSKLAAEHAIRSAGTAVTIVRPSLLDGVGGFGARWIRAMARLPVHFVPVDAVGRIAALDVRDAGEAIAILCEEPAAGGPCEVDLGGAHAQTMAEYMASLRRQRVMMPARCIAVPASIARLISHLCDLLHVSPFSFGHLELMRNDNLPAHNQLPIIVGRAPRPVGTPARDVPMVGDADLGRGLS